MKGVTSKTVEKVLELIEYDNPSILQRAIVSEALIEEDGVDIGERICGDLGLPDKYERIINEYILTTH